MSRLFAAIGGWVVSLVVGVIHAIGRAIAAVFRQLVLIMFLVLAVLFIGLYALDSLTGTKSLPPLIGPSVPSDEDKVVAAQLAALAATINRDSRENSAKSEPEETRVKIAEATVCNAAKFHNRSIHGVLQSGSTLNPPGRTRYVPIATQETVMSWTNGLAGGWAEDMILARQVYARRAKIEADTGCASHYIRKSKPGFGFANWLGLPSLVDVWAQSPLMQAAMRKQMKSVGRARNAKGEEVGTAEFFR